MYSQQRHGLYQNPEKKFRPAPLYEASGYASSEQSRVNTIESSATMPTGQSPPESYNNSGSDEDSDNGAVKVHRYREPQSPEPEKAKPSYPERMYPNQQFRRVDSQPANPFEGTMQTIPNQGRGMATATNGFGPPPYTNSWSAQGPPMSNQRTGHRYGKITIKGDSRVIQGNVYDQHAPPPWLRDHEYESVDIQGRASVIMSDVPISALPMFWGIENGSWGVNQQRQQREQREQAQLPRQ